ncbi:murein biosynthesis integral membrane protein MurJ [Alkalihalobacillus sp. MEB130]|uniref:murein biosynthesis integral membrane protein MurJ n=1 Tax=Alkalihalobacillus sp. MEB130 TaxID=2976704 RepID=UPI0028E01D93|nr:murein biosynthesis integral membrane protein MurJ [Alkalihalobacillus sp. MEB130]MDT8858812.1 murein biosynthesis integral membrane protein MurJ [Alkalihalobacillus sp. MEB130]
MKGKTLFKIIGAVAVINLGSRFIGFLREVVIGYQFGTSDIADSVIAAYTLPNFFYVVLGGAITTAFISIFSKMDDPLRKETFVSSVFTWLSLLLIAFTALLMLFSEAVIGLLFQGFRAEKVKLTADLFQIMAPATLFLVLSMWFTGILNVNGKFTLATTSTLVMNAVFVMIAVLAYPYIGPYAHAYGAIISAIIMAVMLVVLLKKGQFVRFRLNFKIDDDFKKMWRLAFPIILGGATLQFYFLIHRIFASDLAAGAISALNYSSKIVQLPQSVLMTAVTTVIYPLLAKKVAAKEDDDIQTLYQKGLRMMTIIIISATIFAFFYAEEIFRLVFEYGNFTRESTMLAVPLFQLLVIAMFAHSANLYVTRFFYAKERSVLPVTLGVISVFGINVGLNFLLIGQYGASGLATATSISAICNFVMLLVAAKFVLKLTLFGPQVGITMVKFSGLFAGLIGIQLAVRGLITIDMPLLLITVGGMVSILFIGVFLYVFRFPEFEAVRNKLKKRVVKRG